MHKNTNTSPVTKELEDAIAEGEDMDSDVVGFIETHKMDGDLSEAATDLANKKCDEFVIAVKNCAKKGTPLTGFMKA